MKKLIVIALLLLTYMLHSQSSYLYNDNPVFQDYEHFMITQNDEKYPHLSIRNLRRNHLYENMAFILRQNNQSTPQWMGAENDYQSADDSLSQVLNVPEEKKGLFNTFYKNQNFLYSHDSKHFYLRLNPILHFAKGFGNQRPLFYNTRGARIRGGIDQKIFFQAEILENQTQFPNYVERFINDFRAIPANGLYNNYDSDFFGVTQGRDFNNSRGSISWNFSEHISATLAHDRNFIGDGHRSMILSDFSNNYFFGRLDTRVWKLHYTNIWGQLQTSSANAIRGAIPTKWFALHYLSFHVNPKLRFGLFETVVFQRDVFEWNYLIPVIFYRSVERSLGSPDNMLLGFDGRWDIAKAFSVYGQFSFDEFRFDELFVERRGWWANKFAWQVGAKWFNALNIENLNLLAEWNSARPYTYTHRDSLQAFTHYNMPMTHPLGANFQEFLIKANFHLNYQWYFSAGIHFIEQGRSDQNVGWDILRPNSSRVSDFGNEWLQGDPYNVVLLDFQVDYKIFPGLFAYINTVYRNGSSYSNRPEQNDFFVQTGLRLNVTNPKLDF